MQSLGGKCVADASNKLEWVRTPHRLSSVPRDALAYFFGEAGREIVERRVPAEPDHHLSTLLKDHDLSPERQERIAELLSDLERHECVIVIAGNKS